MSGAASHATKRLSGYLWHELYFWHHGGPLGSMSRAVQPTRHFEAPETKRRLHNLLQVSGLMEQLQVLKPRTATISELARVHTPSYIDSVAAMSADTSKIVHLVGDESSFMPGGFEIASLAAGGALTAMEAMLSGSVGPSYALTRPPGHHATRSAGAGFCFFNNVAVAASAALAEHGLERVAVVDWDVHHGNGTQDIFWEDERVLFISLHQAGNYPLHSGDVTETGAGRGEGYTLNLPLPPGSGSGAYRAAFERVVLPALDAYKPELILVSAGFDASYMDPLGHMMLSSDDYRWFTERLLEVAGAHAGGRLLAVHEGGYSDVYVPFCGLAVVEALAGVRSQVVDPYLADVSSYGYQELQPHQEGVIRNAESALQLLLAKIRARGASRAAGAAGGSGAAAPARR